MSQLLANVVVTASLALLIAVSFSAVYWVARFFHLALAGIIVTGAYCGYAMVGPTGSSSILVVVGAALGGTLLGVALEFLVHRPLRLRGASGSDFLVASLGAYVVIVNGIGLLWGEQVRVLVPAHLPTVISISGTRITVFQAIEVVTAIALAVSVSIVLRATMAGKVFRAVASDSELANVVGAGQAYVQLAAVLFSSLVAALVGLLVAADVDLRPGLGFPLLLLGVTAALLGRSGSVASLVVGAAVVSLGQNLGAWFFGMQWRESVTLLVLLATLYLRRKAISVHLNQRLAGF